MIRISRIRERSQLRLIVEGSLSGVWVAELEKCWLGSAADERLMIELSAVSYIDDDGRNLIRRMLSDGADVQATGVMTRGIIDEITADLDSSDGRQM